MNLSGTLRRLVVGVVASVVVAGCATAPGHVELARAGDRLAPLLPMRDFVARTDRTGGYVLSPDGERLLWSQVVGLDSGLAVRPVARPDAVTAYPVGNQGRRGGYYAWLGDSRHFIYSKDETGDENTRLLVQDSTSPALAPWAVTPARGVRAWVVARGPAGTARFLLAHNQRDRSTFDLYEADATTRTVRELARSDGRVLTWLVDTESRLAGRLRQRGDSDGSGQVLEWLAPNGGWRTAFELEPFDTLAVLRIDTTAGQAWALSNRGRNRIALVALDMASGRETVLAQHDRVDLSAAQFASRQGAPAGVLVEPDYPQMQWLAGDLGAAIDRAAADAVARGLVRGPVRLARLQGNQDQADRLLLRVLADFDSAELLWERASGQLTRLNTALPRMAEELAAEQPFSVTASDGRRLDGYLIRPRGVSGPVPLVVDIHGGPWMRESWSPASYNSRQMLANRGYAVMTLNYRGSTGYGREHLWAGAHEYWGRLQQDIAEAAQWAADQGYADRSRMAVLGASFGGFSVLAQLAQKRQDWRCGVNIVGVADWSRLMEDWPPFWRNRHWFQKFYGDPSMAAEREAMRQQSPITHLDAITAPLLVVHGANDIRVLRRDSDDVVRSLQARGHPVHYLVFPDEGHSISKWRNRLSLWRSVEDLFESCLGGRNAGFDLYELMPRGQ
jgi:dipeptidyl aminopeptidase/acylaminoacyl peptidase